MSVSLSVCMSVSLSLSVCLSVGGNDIINNKNIYIVLLYMLYNVDLSHLLIDIVINVKLVSIHFSIQADS